MHTMLIFMKAPFDPLANIPEYLVETRTKQTEQYKAGF